MVVICQVGIGAWAGARDSSGFTPEDYARLRGYESYTRLVQRKMRGAPEAHHLAIDVPPVSAGRPSEKAAAFCVEKKAEAEAEAVAAPPCGVCVARRWPARGGGRGNFASRPTAVLMVGIAAVCICVGLLLHSPPEVFSVRKPFRWELLNYGYI